MKEPRYSNPSPVFVTGIRERRLTQTVSYMSGYVGLLAVSVIALAGCAAWIPQPQLTCEVEVLKICSRAVDAQLQNGSLTVSFSPQQDEGRVVPIIVPVLRQDGALAAEVDCYADIDAHTYSIVQSALAIPPESEESVGFLRQRHLCADTGAYAQATGSLVRTASAQ